MLAKPQKRLLGSVRCSGVNTWPREGARLVLSRPKAAKLTPARSGGSRSEGVARCPPNVRGACPGSAPSRDRPASVRAALRYPTACEDGIQLVGAAPQLRERVAVGVFGEPAPIGVAEDVGEEEHFVVARRLEQNDVGVRVLPGVALHADAHARVDEGAKSLRQHGHGHCHGAPGLRRSRWQGSPTRMNKISYTGYSGAVELDRVEQPR